MRKVAVIGVGMTPFGKFPNSTLKGLSSAAITAALSNAGVDLRRVEAVFAANAIAGLITGQEMVRGQVVLRHLGFAGVPVVNVENACAGGATALHLAYSTVATGQADIALAYGVEKMSHTDRARTIRAIATAMDVEDPIDSSAKSPFMAHYAERIRCYMDDTGATGEDFARVAVKAQRNGALNERAQYGSTTVTVEDILRSPMVADPLTVMMCSPIGDGAAATVLASIDALPRLSAADPIWVEASVLGSGSDPEEGPQAIARAATAAYEMAGIEPGDLDLLELHDANAASEVMRYEDLGLVPEGEGVKLIREGITELSGQLPVNPSGGLLARGHPIGATGCAQVVEAVLQLRGQAERRQVANARVALVENGGGFVASDVAADAVHILTA